MFLLSHVTLYCPHGTHTSACHANGAVAKDENHPLLSSPRNEGYVMAVHRFTDKWLQSPGIIPSNGRAGFVDAICPGLHLRITIKGTRTFSVLARPGGKAQRITIGTYPRVTLSEARDTALETLRAADRGTLGNRRPWHRSRGPHASAARRRVCRETPPAERPIVEEYTGLLPRVEKAPIPDAASAGPTRQRNRQATNR